MNGIYLLGVLHANGEGIPQDTNLVLKLIRRAADMGRVDAIAVIRRMNRPAFDIRESPLYAQDPTFRKEVDTHNVIHSDQSGVARKKCSLLIP